MVPIKHSQNLVKVRERLWSGLIETNSDVRHHVFIYF